MEQQILEAVLGILPFSLSEIENVEENCGTMWIELKTGKVYALSVMECEEEESVE